MLIPNIVWLTLVTTVTGVTVTVTGVTVTVTGVTVTGVNVTVTGVTVTVTGVTVTGVTVTVTGVTVTVTGVTVTVTGVVSSVKESYGFLQLLSPEYGTGMGDAQLFFHFNELYEANCSPLVVGDEIEFTVSPYF